jgi:cbb3-type cytochrome oxidase cytochrome c subunit
MSDGKNTDKAAMIAAIKKRLAEGPGAGSGAAAAAPADAGGGDAAAPAGDDMAARIAALKAKVEATKGQTAPKAAATAAKPKARANPSKNVYPIQPINKTGFGDERLYEENTVNKWFILGGILLTVSVLGMWKRDHDRNWKPYQQEHRLLTVNRLRAESMATGMGLDVDTLAALDARLVQIQGELEARQDQLDELTDERNEWDGKYYAANQDYQITKSEMDQLRYDYEHERLLHGDDSEALADADQVLDDLQVELAANLLVADEFKAGFDAVDAQIKALRAGEIETTRELDGLLEEQVRIDTSLAKIEPSLFNDWMRNMPMADMLAPTLKVDKIVLDKLRDNYNFMHVGKVDMCTTCHVTINDPVYDNWDDANVKPWHKLAGDLVVEDDSRTGQRVFNAHPRLDLFVSDDSPHPMGEFGCTTCHLGRGQAIEFERTFHTPTADAYESAHEKEQRWVEEYDYDPSRHYWDWPMTPTDKLYSSCFTCHSETDRIPGVPEYNESRALIEDLGCYGCHKVKGLEHLRKAGPDLTRLVTKTSPEWSRKWSLSPQAFRPSTRMPHFWHQSNTGAPASATIDPDMQWLNNSDNYVDDWSLRNQIEARAVMAYVYDQSAQAVAAEGFQLQPTPPEMGDPESGREVFELRGCLGCHAITSEGWNENTHGPDLSSMGSKVSAQWLYNWILEPKKYFPESVMPDLRLTEQEAWDITAYLLELRDEEWEALPDAASDDAIVEQIAKEYLASVAGEAWADGRIAEMRAEGGDAAVEVYAGQKLFERYGCAGCHMVPGHYEDMGVGTELSYEALKELTKFDFGHEAAHNSPEPIHHNLPAWFEHKMTDPRIFDRLPVIGTDDDGEVAITLYEQKVKLPGEKLKMPNFYLTPNEVALVTQFLLGTRDDGIDATMKRSLTADEALVEDGSRLITKYNCIGCHRMGQLPTRLPLGGSDFDEKYEALEELTDNAMEYGLWMASPSTTGDVTMFHTGEWLSDEFFLPSEEETWDIFDFFDEFGEDYEYPTEFDVYGAGEGGMGQYIEDAALRPPVLRAEGEKVNPDWLYEFLLEPYIVRTHLQVRMPSFGLSEHESLALVRWFSAQADQPWPFEVDTDPVKDEALYAKGEDFFADVFQCNKCHPAGDQMPASDPLDWGPDLGLAKHRLKRAWMTEWLKNPSGFQPGTRMPSFFGEYSDGEYEPMYDDGDERMEAMVHYMKHLELAGE